MVCLRGHYFIDLISGVIFAHYAWMLSERYSYLVDVKLFRIPFQKRFPMFTRSCPRCQLPVSLWATDDNNVATRESTHAHARGSGDKGENYEYIDRGGM